MCNNTCYICMMIQTIRHKGIRMFYETGNGSKLQKEQLAKISRILTALDALSAESDIRSLGSGIHQLKGEYKGFWSISVTGNYRIIFTFRPPDVFDVDYLDYH
jgi:toxin HigB-1